MKYIFQITITLLLLNFFGVPSIAVAQYTNNPYQQPNQYQPPINQPEPQAIAPEPAAPPEQPALYQGTPAPAEPTPQVQRQAAPEVSLPVANVDATKQQNLSSTGYYVLYTVIAALALFCFTWWRKWLKRKKTTDLPAEDDGTVCKTCGGKGTITKTRTLTAPCNHCKQTGRDICHHCGGSGRYNGGFTVPQTQEEVESLMKCDYCEGSGFTTPALPCCMCKGKKKEEYQESYEAPCPTCNGTGRTAR